MEKTRQNNCIKSILKKCQKIKTMKLNYNYYMEYMKINLNKKIVFQKQYIPLDFSRNYGFK